jgi:hypothetical protein
LAAKKKCGKLNDGNNIGGKKRREKLFVVKKNVKNKMVPGKGWREMGGGKELARTYGGKRVARKSWREHMAGKYCGERVARNMAGTYGGRRRKALKGERRRQRRGSSQGGGAWTLSACSGPIGLQRADRPSGAPTGRGRGWQATNRPAVGRLDSVCSQRADGVLFLKKIHLA